MSEQFINLVSQANPATRQYQPTINGYPPASNSNSPYNHNSPQVLDPFFDDDDDTPDSAFAMGRTTPMQSQASGLPLRDHAAPPAGTGFSKTSLQGDGMPQGWDDADVQLPPGVQPFAGSAAFPGAQTPTEKTQSTRRKKWRWPWQKEEQLVGERVIALNNAANNADYPSNFVSTSKYNMVTFVPKFLTGERNKFRLHDEFLNFFKSNSQNTQISSSYSPLAYNKYRVYRQRTDGRPLRRWE